MNLGSVLVVEGDLTFRTLLQEVLELRHLKVYATPSPVEALILLQHHPIDLILCNLHLPDGDGYTLIRTLRAWESAQGRAPIPAIAISILLDRDYEPIALAAGFQAYLQKPFRTDTLVATIEQVLASS